MNFFALATLLAAVSTSYAVRVSYDNTYDNAGGSLLTVACSDGDHGLITRGFDTFGSLPVFPYVGGAEAITVWNDADCGSCWSLTYTNVDGDSRSINMLAIDVAGSGFVLSQEAMDDLTGGRATEIGVADVQAVQVDASACGL